ncbi:MAG: FAD-dependent monooxygenase [Deltaproteobacteria bacterium]|nr:FAD-dependent monooxygenase [Deltaproteobacteria bacterium]MBI3295761.1 FAD-dependent monooxygenase [Deltaproteobacteria bacterium]
MATPVTAPIAIVGGGLVGSVLATYLARRGFQSDVFERRGDMRRESVGEGRSINLAISVRGLHALEEIGLKDEVLPHIIQMPGRMVHMLDGRNQFQPYGASGQCINSVSRNGLNKMLMTGAEKTGRVRFQFYSTVTGIDFETNTLQIMSERDGKRREATYERILGTDGSASVIRHAMRDSMGVDTSESHLSHGYKEVVMPALPGGGFAIEKNALHIWPRGKDMLIALPNEEGSFTCTLFLPFEGERSFAALNDKAAVESFFESQFVDALDHIPNLTEEFFGHPTGKMVTVKAGPWFVKGRVLLLGDAAHAIVPFFGQGMNCGFEDCSVLNECLEKWGEDWDAAFDDFYSRRKSNADAIADMAIENFIEMRDKVADTRFQLEKKVERLLQAAFPSRYVPRYTLVSFTRTPYREAYEKGLIQQKILDELCDGIEIAEDVDIARAKKLVEAML